MVGESVQSDYGKFKCFMDQRTKKLLIIIPDEVTMDAFTSSTLLNILHIADTNTAEIVLLCIKNDLENKSKFP